MKRVPPANRGIEVITMSHLSLGCSFVAWVLAALALGAGPVRAEDPPAAETPQQRDARMQWWREARFGMFIHWGPISLKGTEIGWSRNPGPNGRRGGKFPAAVYDALYKDFNPTLFNAKEWVAIAKAAGMKYLVFTTKHHDGFCEFDSKLTDYKITSPQSPFKRDVVKELADACHEAGIRLGFYYSQPDSHHPDYRTADHARYIEYLHGQVRELLSNYGQVDVIWFDGLGGSAKDWDAEALQALIRKLQPGILINNRCGLPADFDTPEQTIGRYQVHRPWESCITICRQWAWKPADTMKSLQQCLHTLILCAGGDGNLLFNVGPMPTGEIEPRQVERLKEMGQWLARYGQTIYATRGGPIRPGPWGCTTYKDDTIYVHVLKWPGDSLVLPAINRKVLSATALTGGRAEVKQGEEGVEIRVAPADRQDIDTIVALKLDGPAADVKPAALAGCLSSGKKASASNVFQKMHQYSAAKALDDDEDTRWATDAGTTSAWLEVDLGQPTAVGRVRIVQDPRYAARVRKFELQYKDGEDWKTILSGTTTPAQYVKSFEAVTVRHVRLNILDASDGPTINEFQLFAPGK